MIAHVYNSHNRYMIRPGPLVKLDKASPEEREAMSNHDIEMSYKEEGEQLLEPHLMNEPMYLVVRSLIDRGVKQDCILKENDIIKFGRAKFRVQEIVIQEKEKQKERLRRKAENRKKEWKDKASKEAVVMAKKVKKSPRYSSSNLPIVCE